MRLLFLVVACALAPAALRAQVLITEFMYDPVTDRGSEYVELFNAADTAVVLAHWRLYDASRRRQALLPDSAVIAAHGYFVIAADTLFFAQFPALAGAANVWLRRRASLGLNSDGDEIVLRDSTGRTIDSVAYLPQWHRPDLDNADGTSLERASLSASSTDARTWSSSVARYGGTPAAANSILIAPSVAEAEIEVEPATISPDADGFEDAVRISYRLPMRTARVTIALHDRQGRLIDRIANNEPSGPEGEIVWRGYDPGGMPLPPEIYVLVIEAYDPVGVALATARTGVVVARR